ncbi:MAG: ribosomal protein S18-alanine N-acetyltransferase [Candidatus Marinimicrobia bacterium]|nr:ribosomal protein S18-alanine N-acetyltransferase [Candidatus Neomarinimicrobiota bacterium]
MIISATQNHLHEILHIERESFDKPWSEYHFKSDLKNKISVNWVYQKENHVVGYLFGWHVMDEYHLNNIAVEERSRGAGIGINLLKNMLIHLKEIEVKSVFLEVSSGNLPARNLYEKIGFVPQGERKDYYTKGDDAVLYTLEF